jgi:SlyX protein
MGAALAGGIWLKKMLVGNSLIAGAQSGISESFLASWIDEEGRALPRLSPPKQDGSLATTFCIEWHSKTALPRAQANCGRKCTEKPIMVFLSPHFHAPSFYLGFRREPWYYRAMEQDSISSKDSLIEALETKISYQEATIAELSSSLYDHEQRLERLERLFKELATKFKEVAGDGFGPLPANERPPHY